MLDLKTNNPYPVFFVRTGKSATTLEPVVVIASQVIDAFLVEKVKLNFNVQLILTQSEAVINACLVKEQHQNQDPVNANCAPTALDMMNYKELVRVA